jgi:hypothetical protein
MFYEPTVARQCREPIAEEVRDKQAANFCDYFSPRNDAYQPPGIAAAQHARAQLDGLFGAKSSAAPVSVNRPDSADAARAALNDLFNKK